MPIRVYAYTRKCMQMCCIGVYGHLHVCFERAIGVYIGVAVCEWVEGILKCWLLQNTPLHQHPPLHPHQHPLHNTLYSALNAGGAGWGGKGRDSPNAFRLNF